MIMARWCHIFIFSNTTYPDEKRGFYTRNDALNLILKSDFDLKWQKIDIFFHSLLFSTLKYDYFSDFSGNRSGLELPSVHALDIFLCLINYLKLALNLRALVIKLAKYLWNAFSCCESNFFMNKRKKNFLREDAKWMEEIAWILRRF